jgi:hypothetical protein
VAFLFRPSSVVTKGVPPPDSCNQLQPEKPTSAQVRLKKQIKVKEFLMAEGKAAHGWAARDASGHLSPFNFSRRYVFLFTDCDD